MVPNKDPKKKPKQKEVEVIEEEIFCNNLATFIRKNKSLIHLNLNEMNLGTYA